jgi:hypothetical protein
VSLCPTSTTCSPGDIMKTAVLTNPFQGFQPWREQDFTFVPTSTTEVLSFLAIGTPATGAPNAGPPFVLVDGGVSLVPEPATWPVLGISLVAIAGVVYRRRKSGRVPDKAGVA